MSKGEIQCDVTVGADDEYRHLVDLLGKVLDQPHRGVVRPVEVGQNVDSRLVAAGTSKEFLFDDRGDTVWGAKITSVSDAQIVDSVSSDRECLLYFRHSDDQAVLPMSINRKPDIDQW